MWEMTGTKRNDKEGKDMKVIGITGGVGAGKSTVVGIIQKHIPSVYLHCDVIAHDLMLPDGKAYPEIVRRFGEQILNEDKTINRKALYEASFPTGRVEELNACVHPLVREFVEETIARLRAEQFEGYILIEAALLIEAGYREICDELWYVTAPEALRRERLAKDRGYTEEKIDSIMAQQSSEEFFRQNCDFVLMNDSSFEECDDNIMGQIEKHQKEVPQ